MDLDQTFARIITNARPIAGMTAAEFDYDIAYGSRNGRASMALDSAIWGAANAGHPEVTEGAHQIVKDRDRRAHELHLALRGHITAFIEAAKQKRYLGWSDAARSRGHAIRYAD